MSINTNYSILAKNIKTINNPSWPVGTLIEEIPTDIGRSWAGYKRGGILEGAEKLRKELMAAAVWMFGIPVFNKLGNIFCENILKIPTTNIDFSNPKKGNDSVLDTAKYLVDGTKKKGLDYSELDCFKGNKKFNFEKTTAQQLANKISCAKKVTSILAVVLNCIMMGIVIPKINQYLTKKSLNKMKQEQNSEIKKFVSFNEFQKSIKNNSNPDSLSFEGFYKDSNDLTYAVENNSRFRLLITDIPMIIGRMITSRNRYEALEYLIMDGASMYFYNFASEHIQKMLRGNIIPDIQPITVETLVKNPDLFKEGLKKAENNPNIFKSQNNQKPDTVLKNIFGDKIAAEIYKNETYGKYGKANRYIDDSTIKNVNKSVESFINYLKKNGSPMLKDGELNIAYIEKKAKEVKNKNALFLAIGLGVSILGLSVLIPKLTFAVTKFLTGKDEFSGIANYDDDNKKKK